MMADHENDRCDRAREQAFCNGELGALYDALLYCPEVDDCYALVPRWALRAVRDYFARDVVVGLGAGKGRHARWMTRRATEHRDSWLIAGIRKQLKDGMTVEAAIAAVAQADKVPEDTVRHAYDRGKKKPFAISGGTDCPWVAARFQCDVVENPGLWQDSPDCLPGRPCDPCDEDDGLDESVPTVRACATAGCSNVGLLERRIGRPVRLADFAPPPPRK